MSLFIKPGSVRCRIAPSPTGPLHIGTARTALFNYLFAKKYGGVFVLRIEDTDLERSNKAFEKNILGGFSWLGIDWDEGPELNGKGYRGEFGPYRQSERIASYSKYIGKLLDDGKAFYCFHSKKELEFEAEEHMSKKLPLFHICQFRNLSQGEAEAKKTSGQPAIIRFKVPTEPSNHQITFQDLIRGQIHFFTGLLGDFSIAKDLETPLYNFAVVIDDYEMGITHVIRGEDHIPNTPKQLLIAEALGWTAKNEIGDLEPPWKYAHLPLILGPDKSKLSKRNSVTSVDEYRGQGFLPETLYNFMSLLGWNPGDNREIFSKEELIKEFSVEKIQKSGAVFDIQKLDWMNGEYIRKKSSAELVELCRPYLEDFLSAKGGSASGGQFSDEYLKKIIMLEQPRLKKLAEIGERVEYFFREPVYDKELLRWKKMSDEEVVKSLDKSEKIISNFQNLPSRQIPGIYPLKAKQLTSNPISKSEIEKLFLEAIGDSDKGEILWPLRVALTGKKASPGPFEILEILGKGETLKRLKIAREKFIT